MRRLLVWPAVLVIAWAARASAQPDAGVPTFADFCSYMREFHGYSREDCGTLKAGDSELHEAAAVASTRRAKVQALADALALARPQDRDAVLGDPRWKLEPPLGPRTFEAWLDSPRLAAVRSAAEGHPLLQAYVRRTDQRLDRARSAFDGSDARVLMDGDKPRSRGAVSALERSAMTPERPLPRSQLDDLPAPLKPKFRPPPDELEKPMPPPPAPLGDDDWRTRPKTPSPWSFTVDRSADPCTDFFQYACGTWVKDHAANQDTPNVDRFIELQWRVNAQLRDVLEAAANHTWQKDAPLTLKDAVGWKSKGGADPNDPAVKIGDFFAACMDVDGIEKAGLSALQPDLDRIAAISSRSQLPAALGRLEDIGVPAFFGLSLAADPGRSGLMTPTLHPAYGDRSLYVSPGRAKDLQAYAEHLERFERLLGLSESAAKHAAAVIVTTQGLLAHASLPPEKAYDPDLSHHDTAVTDRAGAGFDWKAFLAAQGMTSGTLDVGEQRYLKTALELMRKMPLEDIKLCLRYWLVESYGYYLPKAFRDEDFSYYGRALHGYTSAQPRWADCQQSVKGAMPDELGKMYVERYFSDEKKAAVLAMTKAVEQSMRAELEQADWLSPETRKAALAKLDAVQNNIAFPDKWDDYAGLVVKRDDGLGNALRAAEVHSSRSAAAVGRPEDRSVPAFKPYVVNAAYGPEANSINFPAAILQPPFYDASAGLAANYGAIAAIIGHELTHGFDPSGRKYGPHGEATDWWTKADENRFNDRAQCLKDQYSAYPLTADPDHPGTMLHVNGARTLNENVADNGGLRMAYAAFERNRGDAGSQDGYTPEQQFFLGFGREFCGTATSRELILGSSDPHAAKRARINLSTANMPEFRQAFNCPENAPMAPQRTCRVW